MVGLIACLAVGVSMQDPQIFLVGKEKREAIIISPTKKSDHPPIVFGWHGHGGTMQSSKNMFKIESYWPEAVVVYPQGLLTVATHDPTGSKPGWQHLPGENGDRDLKLFDTILTQMHAKYKVDPKQVYTVGFSNGGGFCYLLWSQRNSKLAAAAIAESKLDDGCKPLQPLPAFIAAGKADTTCPYSDQVVSIKYVRQVDGVATNATPTVQAGVRYFHGAKADLAIMITNLGHQYPNGMTQKIVPFFKKHTKP